MIRLLLVVACLFFGSQSWAATYYFSDCTGSEAVAECAGNEGNDAWDGLAPEFVSGSNGPKKTLSAALTLINSASINVGDSVLFARGGAWAPTTGLVAVYNVKCAGQTACITIGAYQPAWYAGANKPVFQSTSGRTIDIRDGGSVDQDGGWTVQDIRIIGVAGQTVVFVGTDADYVTLQRLEIVGGTLGVQVQGGYSGALNPGADGLSTHFSLLDSSISETGNGALISASNVLIEGNTFTNNGSGAVGDHQLYVDGTLQPSGTQWIEADQIVVRGNTFTDNHVTAAACGSVAVVVHGKKKNLFIENNTVRESTVPTGTGCWGITVDGGYNTADPGTEKFRLVRIAGNRVINYARGIGVDNSDLVVVENNYIYSEHTGGGGAFPEGITARNDYNTALTTTLNSTQVADDWLLSNIAVRNNTIYFTAPSSQTIGIRMAQFSTDPTTQGGHQVHSNLIYLGGTSGTAATACFGSENVDYTRFVRFDNNLCYSADASAPLWMKGGTTASPVTYDLAAWRTATGSTHDMNSLAGNNTAGSGVDPLITTPTGPTYSLAIGSGSPAQNVAHSSASSTHAYGGCKRSTADATPDIGAYELGCTGVVPNPPIRISVQ